MFGQEVDVLLIAEALARHTPGGMHRREEDV